MVLLGLFIAGGVLLLARPRVRADAAGIEVRNIVMTRGTCRGRWWSGWRSRTARPGPGSTCPTTSTSPVLAIQAVDGRRAVDGHHEGARAARRGARAGSG